MHEDLPLTLELLIGQAQRALEQLDKEPADRTRARVRVMTATIEDLRREAKVDLLTKESN